MRIEDVTAETVRPVRRAWLAQSWRDLSFLHWAVARRWSRRSCRRAPHRTRWTGSRYVGLIGFRMVGLGPLRGPGIPYLGTFCETNVRLYSVDGQGRRAVVFRSLEAARLLPVLTAQATLRLPYKWARMRLDTSGDVLRYSSRRRLSRPRPATNAMTVRVGAPRPTRRRWSTSSPPGGACTPTRGAAPCTCRTSIRGGRCTGPSLEHLDDSLITAAGLPAPDGPPVSVLYSPGVPVVFGAPVPA